VIALGPDDAKRVDSRYGYPMAELRSGLTGSSLGPGSGPTLAAWSRVALALEMVGTMDGALAVALEHIRSRRQFGRSIGSFQAVQHRLAEASVLLEGSRWMAREAAFLGAPEEAAATALAQASVATQRVFADVHQLSGAIGFATEHDLHLFSMRLPNLLLEAGSPAAATASLRWAMSGA
jgi:alkylation response protein AidB-like acyl-CoA dehydrogenase